jgi:hypothetical protein
MADRTPKYRQEIQQVRDKTFMFHILFVAEENHVIHPGRGSGNLHDYWLEKAFNHRNR